MTLEAAGIAGYATLLMLAALVLDRLARHTHARTERLRTAGFSFDAAIDAWTCSEGEYLRRIETDVAQRLARYRARAAVCNSCPAKGSCTPSDHGREISRPLDPWPHSEAGRFHRAICVVLLGAAVVILIVGLALQPMGASAGVLAALLLIAAGSMARAATTLVRTPSGFPGGAESFSSGH